MTTWLSLRLVIAQIVHERLSSACLCVALAAAVIPLLLVLGLKDGTVATLRERLASDPANLEIKMQFSGALEPNDIETVRRLPETGFCVPCTRLLAASAMLSHAGGEQRETALVPTAPGDPYLARYGVRVPGEGEIVLPARLADALGVRAGDSVELTVSRRAGGRWERAVQMNAVAGVLPVECDGARSYVPLSLAVAVEEFLEGSRASFGDDGHGGLRLEPVFYGVIAEPASLAGHFRPGLWEQDCPFREEMPFEGADENGGPQEGRLYYNTGQFAGLEKLRRLYARAAQAGGKLWLWNPPATVRFRRGDTYEERDVEALPEPLSFDAGETDIVLYASDHDLREQIVVELGEGERVASVRAFVRHAPGVPSGRLRTTARSLGMLHQARYRHVVWNEEKQYLQQAGRAYARLRVYARDLDSVEPLVDKLNERSLAASGSTADIARVRQLDSQLKVLFALMAAIGVAGAASSLALSLFHNARKRKKDYAVLAALGLPQRALALFPVWEALILTAVALTLALTAFHGMASIIDYVFAGDLSSGESLCRLSPQKHAFVLLLGLSVAVAAAFASSFSILRGQPAAAIREI